MVKFREDWFKICPVGDKQTDRQTDRQTEEQNRLTNILEKSSILQVTRRPPHAEHDTCKIQKINLTSKIIGG